MPTTVTVRPTSTVDDGGWTAWPSGTLHGVTSDDDNSTWAEAQTGITQTMQLGLPTDAAPSANHWRHRVTVRSVMSRMVDISVGPVRIDLRVQQVHSNGQTSTTGWSSWSTTSASPNNVTLQPALTGLWHTVATTWQIWARTPIPNDGTAWGEIRELWLDVDWRARPNFTGQVLDGTNTVSNGGTIDNTVTPTFRFQSPSYDGLPARFWRVAVYTLAQTTAPGFDPFVTNAVAGNGGVGTPPQTVTVGTLPQPESYVAYMQTASTITPNLDREFPSLVQQVAFDLNVDVPNAPATVTATAQSDLPAVDVCWTAPTPGDNVFVGDIAVEVERSDCGGDWRPVHTVMTSTQAGCWDDLAVPISTPEPALCEVGSPSDDCAVTYRVRYWGMVELTDGLLPLATDWTYSAPVVVSNPGGANQAWLGDGETLIPVCVNETWTRSRPHRAYVPVGGGYPTVVTGAPSGRDWRLVFTPTSTAELLAVEAIVANHLIWWQPGIPGLHGEWLSPSAEQGTVPPIAGVTTLTVSTVATGPEPPDDPAVIFGGQ